MEEHVRGLLKCDEPEVADTITVRQLASIEVSCHVFVFFRDEVAPPHIFLGIYPRMESQRGAHVVQTVKKSAIYRSPLFDISQTSSGMRSFDTGRVYSFLEDVLFPFRVVLFLWCFSKFQQGGGEDEL